MANRPISSIAHTTIENAEYGVRIENLIAPALNNVTFLDIVDFQHIVLDETDVYLPSGFWGTGTCASPGTYVASPASWTINGRTYVKATNTCEQDSWIGTAGKVDLVANAPVTTTGSTADGDSVYFHPMEITPVTLPTAGADWGGFTLTPEAAGSLLRFADIGYADVPLMLFYPDGGTSIRRSRIHHFAGVGAWVNGSQGTGGSIDSCVVDRGLQLHGEIGDTGVLLDSADHFAFLRNQVLMHGLTEASGGTGVLVKFSEVFCQGTSGQSRLIRVDANFVMGPGASIPSTPPSLPYSGIKLEWLCGSANREIDVGLNWIEDWRTYGVEVVQTADVQMSCNRVTECKGGLDLYRDFRPTGTSLRLRKNRLEALDQDATLFAVRTNDATKIKLGPDWADRGRNQLMVNVDDTKFIFENDPDSGDQLDARVNYWYTSANLGDPVDDAQEIADRLAPSGYNINYSDHETASPNADPNCTPTRPAGAPPAAAPGRVETLVNGFKETTSATSDVEPARLELGNPFPNPGEAGVTIELAVPADRIGEFRLGVFDVSGRRVGGSTLSVTAGGKFLVAWNGTDRDGGRVAPGLYFLRVQGPGGFEATRRVSVLK